MNKIEFIHELFSQAYKRTDDVLSNHIRLAHYTTESTLMQIIRNKEIWLRNTSRMNDSMEIKYGVNGLAKALAENGNTGSFRSFLMYVFDGDTSYVDRISNIISERGYIDHYITYIACLSEHHMQPNDHENKYGRLSMWRAYGNPSGVSLLFKEIERILTALWHTDAIWNTDDDMYKNECITVCRSYGTTMMSRLSLLAN